jgi:hypothetical protein
MAWKWIATKDHKLKDGKHEIVGTSICDTKTCEFYGKPAAQGVCYSKIITGHEEHFREFSTNS